MYRVAVEIGGTKIQVALGRPSGKIERLERANADASGGREAILEQVASLVERIRTDAEVNTLAIGFGGPVDVQAGRVITSHQVSGWAGFQLRQWAQQKFQLPCRLENDSNCAGLAEAVIGAGAGTWSTFYMNVGSGIGGAFVLDGKLYTTHVGAAEIGHTYVWDPASRSYVVLESVCSGWAIQRRARHLVSSGRESIMRELAENDPERIDGPIIGQALSRKDPLATRLVKEACETLAVALANMIALLNPQRIVIGGGISLMGEPFFEILREELAGRIFQPFQGRQQVIPAALGENVVLAGALLL